MNELEKYELGKIIDRHLLEFTKEVERGLKTIEELQLKIEIIERKLKKSEHYDTEQKA